MTSHPNLDSRCQIVLMESLRVGAPPGIDVCQDELKKAGEEATGQVRGLGEENNSGEAKRQVEAQEMVECLTLSLK